MILVLLALVYLTNSTEHYTPTISIQTISGDKTNTAFYTHPYNDGRRVVVGRFNSISINVGDGVVLNNADTSGTTFDIYVVMVCVIINPHVERRVNKLLFSIVRC